MTLIPTKNTGGADAVVEVTDTVIAQDVLLRVWASVPGSTDATLAADERLTPEQARNLAAALLHAAGKLDGQQVSFLWHREGCTAIAQSQGRCRCDHFAQAKLREAAAAAAKPSPFTVVASGVVEVES